MKKVVLAIAVLSLALFVSSCATTTATIPPPTTAPVIQQMPSSIVIIGPISSGMPAPRANIYHEVGPGETIWRISKMYDVPIEKIVEANNLYDATQIKNGQRLLIPDAAPIKPVVALFKSDKWKYIIVHHSATEFGNARVFDVGHQQRGFTRGLGYHFVIDNGTQTKVDGQIEASPRWIKQLDGAHCSAGGMNSKAIGICLVGDFNNSVPTQQQMDSLVYLVNILRKAYDIPEENILCHRDVYGAKTDCPGDTFPWWEFKQRLITEE